ncbi:glycosyl hydrolase family 47 domain-containing protein [Ditylenchus destructor]|nr:glycosyl hydrolase family 47 domain-containing protein [Ditylenchus destructor]
MKTIYPKTKAVGFAISIALFFLLLLLIVRYFPNETPAYNARIGRDVQIRNEIEAVIKQQKVDDQRINPDGMKPIKKALRRKVAMAPSNSKLDSERRSKIVEMIKHAWENYRKFAWGYNELKPLARSSHFHPIFGGEKMMATMVDGADTLWIVGLNDSYNEARDYIRDNFDMSNAKQQLSVFEITIRHIGGFLSLYSLTNETFYVEKAKSVADALLIAFDTPTGIPLALVNPVTKTATNYGWVPGGASILSELGSLHLEFEYLSEVTGEPIYAQKVKKVRDYLYAKETDGMYYNYISPGTGQFFGDDVSIGAMGDSFYELLLKSWLVSGRTDNQAYKMYKEASYVVQKHLLAKSATTGLTYLAELRSRVQVPKMYHLACFTPGMFALEAQEESDPSKRSTILDVAEKVAHTCREHYVGTKTGLAPEMLHFGRGNTYNAEAGYLLRPEAIEGWFYLWRITRNQKYKEWVWEAITAIEKYCRTPTGYVGLNSNSRSEIVFNDVQQTFFIAETLKYAYLTFDDNALPLDKYVFTTEAHPFPVREIPVSRYPSNAIFDKQNASYEMV